MNLLKYIRIFFIKKYWGICEDNNYFKIVFIKSTEKPLVGYNSWPFHTYILNLTVEDYISKYRSTLRNEIKRFSVINGIEFETHFDINRFLSYCREIGGETSNFNFTDLNGSYLFTELTVDGIKLSSHCIVLYQEKARLLYSVSNRDVGKILQNGNKYLHHLEFAFFKSKGYSEYDLGGKYTGSQNKKLMSINLFKESFGPEEKVLYNNLNLPKFIMKFFGGL